MAVYVTLLPGAFNDNDPSIIGRTVKVEEIRIEEDDGVWFGFTWAENPYDTEMLSSTMCRTATDAEIVQARMDYANQGKRFVQG